MIDDNKCQDPTPHQSIQRISHHTPTMMDTEQHVLWVKYLHVPLFAHGIDHAALDGSPAGAADRHAQLIVTRQTVQLTPQLPGFGRQLLTESRITQP